MLKNKLLVFLAIGGPLSGCIESGDKSSSQSVRKIVSTTTEQVPVILLTSQNNSETNTSSTQGESTVSTEVPKKPSVWMDLAKFNFQFKTFTPDGNNVTEVLGTCGQNPTRNTPTQQSCTRSFMTQFLSPDESRSAFKYYDILKDFQNDSVKVNNSCDFRVAIPLDDSSYGYRYYSPIQLDFPNRETPTITIQDIRAAQATMKIALPVEECAPLGSQNCRSRVAVDATLQYSSPYVFIGNSTFFNTKEGFQTLVIQTRCRE